MAKFEKGRSGNPKGRPRGIVDKRSALREALADDLPAIVKAMIEAAKGGDVQAASLILSRTLPPLRPERVPVSLDVGNDASMDDMKRAIAEGMAAGKIAPDTGRDLLEGLALATEGLPNATRPATIIVQGVEPTLDMSKLSTETLRELVEAWDDQHGRR